MGQICPTGATSRRAQPRPKDTAASRHSLRDLSGRITLENLLELLNRDMSKRRIGLVDIKRLVVVAGIGSREQARLAHADLQAMIFMGLKSDGRVEGKRVKVQGPSYATVHGAHGIVPFVDAPAALNCQNLLVEKSLVGFAHRANSAKILLISVRAGTVLPDGDLIDRQPGFTKQSTEPVNEIEEFVPLVSTWREDARATATARTDPKHGLAPGLPSLPRRDEG